MTIRMTRYVRLWDVFVNSIIYLYIGYLVDNIYAKIGMIIIGIGTLLYNLNNLLYLDYGIIDKSYFGIFTTINGKTQIHRLYNLFIMYPFMIFVYTQLEGGIIKIILMINIIVGIIYNGYNYIKLL